MNTHIIADNKGDPIPVIFSTPSMLGFNKHKHIKHIATISKNVFTLTLSFIFKSAVFTSAQ